MALHLIDYNAIFIHIPKTGGTFVRHVLTDVLKLCTEEVGYKHSHPNLIGTIALEGKYTFAFTRNPAEWYRSYWSMKQWHLQNATFGELYEPDLLWHPTWYIDKNFMAQDFNVFVRDTERFYPGFVRQMFDTYTRGIDFCGDQVNLLEDLALVLRSLRVPFRKEQLNVDRVNESMGKPRALYLPEVRAMVEENNALSA